MKKADEDFKYWWEGDEGDPPITDVKKKRAKEIFMAGYAAGSRQPIYTMSRSQHELLVKVIRKEIEKEKS